MKTWRSKISVRTFAWHDLITFYRYRHQIVSTDSAQALTRGGPVGPMAFLAHFNPAMGIFTCVQSAPETIPLIGQMHYTAGERSARIAFLMPEPALAQPGLNALLERMAWQAGDWGAFHLLAEVEETSCAMEGMRRSGFSVYAWQRIWQFAPPSQRNNEPRQQAQNGKNGKNDKEHGGCVWQPASSVDEVMIRNLYQALVPPLVQSAEPLIFRRQLSWVYRQEGEILAYVEGTYGPHGIYFQPLIHPAVENVSQALTSLLAHQRNPLGRPMFLAVRSYQAWLETVVRSLECQVGPRQALMAKHLVLQQRSAVQVARHSMLEKYTAEPTVPMVNNVTTANK